MVTRQFPEGIFDTRIYWPKVGLHPNPAQAKYVGKPVTVVWQTPVFSLFGGGGELGPLHEMVRWDGYVLQFDKLIPQDELTRLVRIPHKPKDSQ